MPRKTTTAKKKNSGNNAGCLIWLILMLVILLLFVLNWGKIQTTIKNTGFDKLLGFPIKTETKPEPLPVDPSTEPSGNQIIATDPGASGTETDNAAPITPEANGSTGKPEGTATQVPTTTAKPVNPAGPVEQLKKTRVVNLYFIRVEDDGTIARREVKRTIEVSDSPLTDALNSLLKGPGPDELSGNLITLIPPGTRILSVQVRGSTAIINFSEEFMYNKYGVEGYAGQLKQIVYTATSFSNVKDVQILIEGQRYEYLGGEGVYIGKPISRSSL